jgi:hypothetical protein
MKKEVEWHLEFKKENGDVAYSKVGSPLCELIAVTKEEPPSNKQKPWVFYRHHEVYGFLDVEKFSTQEKAMKKLMYLVNNGVFFTPEKY